MCSDFSLNNITNNTLCSFSLFPFGKRAEEVKPCTQTVPSRTCMCSVSCSFNNIHTRRQSTPRRGVKHRDPPEPFLEMISEAVLRCARVIFPPRVSENDSL